MKSWKEQLKDAMETLVKARSNVPVRKCAKRDTPKAAPLIRSDGNALHMNQTPSGVKHSKGSVIHTHHRSSNRANDPVDVKKPSEPTYVSAPPKDRPVHSNRLVTEPDFRPRFGVDRFLIMPDWSDIGLRLQHPQHQDGRPMVVRIGLDFGTAFTKVAIRAGGDLVPLDWSAVTGNESASGRYVLPGFICRTSGGEYCWRRLSESQKQGNLKFSVMDTAGSGECPTAALAFLALVIRYTRAYLYREPRLCRKLENRSLCWELNIGCPTEPYEKPEMVDLFRRIARIAWLLAGVNDLNESFIDATWRKNEKIVGLETEPGVIPEFVAQIAGYLHSNEINKGLHAMFDVGAATLDVATFNVVLPDERNPIPRIPIFYSAVKKLGTHYLNYQRHVRLGCELSWDDSDPVETAACFAKRFGIPELKVREVENDFEEKVTKCIVDVIEKTRNTAKGNPKSSAWSDCLPIFVTGGGRDLNLYRDGIKWAANKLCERIGKLNIFRFTELDPTGPFKNSVKLEHGRLAVAIGLTEDAENIARVVPHHEIPPIYQKFRGRKDHTEIYGD
jgi:hypothetical protein